MEIDTKSSQNTYEMYILVNFWNLMKKTGKKYRIRSKKLIFDQTYMKLVVAMETLKNDGHTIDISKYS